MIYNKTYTISRNQRHDIQFRNQLAKLNPNGTMRSLNFEFRSGRRSYLETRLNTKHNQHEYQVVSGLDPCILYIDFDNQTLPKYWHLFIV